MTATSFGEDSGPARDPLLAMWHGSLSNIPSGWVLADGNNGSPDLTNQFIRAPTNYSDGPGASAGQHTVNLSEAQLPSHDHTASDDSTGSHQHGVDGGDDGDHDSTTDKTVDEGNHDSTMSTDAGGSHTHSANFGSTGSGNGIDNRPSYYEAAMIYKL